MPPPPLTPVAPTPFSLSALATELSSALGESLKGLIEASKEDATGVNGFVGELSLLSMRAASTGNVALLEEANANLPWIAERFRVRAVNAEWASIGQILTITTRGAMAALASFGV